MQKTTIAHIAHKFFTSDEGEKLLDYLRAKTINQVLAPPIEASEVIYMEGRRSVYADLVELIDISEKIRKSNGANDGSNGVTNIYDRASRRLNRDDKPA